VQAAGANPNRGVPELTDGAVILNGFTLDDVEAHLAGEDEETARRFGWWPRRSTAATVASAIRRWEEAQARRALSRCGALSRANWSGTASFGSKEMESRMSPTTGCGSRRCGDASRALRLMSDWALRELGVERLELYVEPDNAPSRAVARKAGFVEEGLLRKQGRSSFGRHDMLLYSRLPTDV
jgi:uncharacterized protein YjiS (DUF1127 family)